MRVGAPPKPEEQIHETTAKEVSRARLRVWLGVTSAVAGVVGCLGLANAGIEIKPLVWLAAAGLCAVIAALCSSRARGLARGMMLAALLALFGGLTATRVLHAHAAYLPTVMRAMTADEPRRAGVVISVEGVVLSTPRASPPPQGPLAQFLISMPATRTWVEMERVEIGGSWCEGRGRLLLVTQGLDAPRVTPGQRVRVLGVYAPPRERMNPGEPSRLRRAMHDGYAGVLETSSPELVERVADASGMGLLIAMREAMRERARETLERATAGADAESRALARALLLGEDDDPASADIAQAFTRLGLSHVLSISGFHLTVMAMVTLYVLRLTGDRGWVEPALIALAVLVYTLIVPLEAPILRSALMVLALLATEATGRRYDRVCVLGLITLALIAWRPLDVLSLGFQLSVGLTAMLLWAGESMQWRLFGQPVLGLIEDKPTVFTRVLEGTKSAIAIGVMCWLVSLPVLMHTTGLVSPLGVLATLVVSPVIVLALWAGYISLALGSLAPWLALPAGWVLTHATGSAAWAARFIDGVPLSSMRTPDPGVAWTLLVTTWLVVLARFGHRWRKRWITTGLAACALTYVVVIMTPWRMNHVALRVTALHVGDGTCMLLSTGDDAILWDCKTAPRAGILPGIVAAVRAQDIHRVRRVVITHPDIDHFAGLFEVIEPLGVREVLVPARFVQQATNQPGGAASVTLRELASRNVRVETLVAGDTVMLGDTRGTILAPHAQASFENDNDHSFVMLLEAPTTAPQPGRVLLTGDIGPQAIEALLGATTLPVVDAMELPHHGSFNVAAPRLLEAAQPRVVMQSTGPRRLDDARWGDSRDRGAWLVTARDGAIDVKIDIDGTLRTRVFAPGASGVR